MSSIITLTTDFGLSDAYVASMKGVMLGINPDLIIVDICHMIDPQNVSQASFVLGTSYKYFPQRTIHIAVVDPGVGTERRAIILRTPLADFVAPDNGILSHVIQQWQSSMTTVNNKQNQVELTSELEAIVINQPQFWHPPISKTFQGRDILAPVAARLSLGVPLTDFGQISNSLVLLPLSSPYQARDSSLRGHIQYIDNFGNLITDIKSSDLPFAQKTLKIEIGNQTIIGLSQNYTEGEDLLALIDSANYLEIALRNGNAATKLNSKVGDTIKVVSGAPNTQKKQR